MKTFIHRIAAASLLVQAACGPVQEHAAAPGLVAYWKFDETGGTRALDSSGNGNDGVYVQSPEPSADAPPVTFPDPRGRTFVQGRGQYVDVPGSPSLRLTGSLSVAAWVKPAAEKCADNQGIAERFTWTGTEASGGFTLRLN